MLRAGRQTGQSLELRGGFQLRDAEWNRQISQTNSQGTSPPRTTPALSGSVSENASAAINTRFQTDAAMRLPRDALALAQPSCRTTRDRQPAQGKQRTPSHMQITASAVSSSQKSEK